MMPPVPTKDQFYLAKIQKILDEAYDHYFKRDSYCKPDEGGVTVNFNNYFDRRDGDGYLKIESVEIYSYVFGPNRLHEFGSLEEAYETVKKWHAREMSRDYDEE